MGRQEKQPELEPQPQRQPQPQKPLKPRHQYLLRMASLENNSDQWAALHQGIFLLDRNQLVWLAGETLELECYMLFPRKNLIISNEYEWKWESRAIANVKNSRIEVVKLTEWTRWVEVKGEFSTVNLQMETKYKVSFIVKLESSRSMVNMPITLSLVLPNGSRQELLNYVNLCDSCSELNAGNFIHKHDTIGNISFSLTQSTSKWKRGIVIMGVQIKPEEATDCRTKSLFPNEG